MVQLTFEEWKMKHPALVEQYSEEESTCPNCQGQKVLEIGGEFVECDLCMGVGYVLAQKTLFALYEADRQTIWKQSGSQGRVLHLIDPAGLAQCGRQFDPQKTQEPEVTPNAPTLSYCPRCMQANLARQTDVHLNSGD
jgi:predicted Zn-ribbon and HTH transcriptional regulator